MAPAGQTRHRKLTLGNTGSLRLDFEIAESGGRRQTVVATARLPRKPNANPNARSTRDLYDTPTPVRGWTPDAPGDVLAQFPTGLGLGWGVGYEGDVWLSDVFARKDVEFDIDGTPTGTSWGALFGEWPRDMAFDNGRGWMCQVAVGGDNGIHCFDPAVGGRSRAHQRQLGLRTEGQGRHQQPCHCGHERSDALPLTAGRPLRIPLR